MIARFRRTSPRAAAGSAGARLAVTLVPRPLGPPIRPADALHWILRIAVAAEFVGHGAFGIITKAGWLPYFALVGVPEWLAWRLMPVVGAVDIMLGILTLVSPRRLVLLYMATWGVWTAALRPLAGEGAWEFLERAGNFGVPLALLYLSGFGASPRHWLARVTEASLDRARAGQIALLLRVTTALLLIGHGGFGLVMRKPEWARYLGAVGLGPGAADTASPAMLVGGFEIALGLLVLAWPAPGLLLFVVAWKVGTELLRPLTGEPFWEFVERGGSYAAPLGLLYLHRWSAALSRHRPAPHHPAGGPDTTAVGPTIRPAPV
jgi:hypothetical protein